MSQHKKTIEDIYPLSQAQLGMLFHTLEARGSGAYVMHLGATLRGVVSPEALRAAFQDVAARHPALRTAFVWEGVAEPLQVVRPRVNIRLLEEDLRRLSFAEQASHLEAWKRTDRVRGFEVSRAPLMRLSLFRLSDDLSYLAWSHHHLILDGWSTPLVLAEVLAFYEERMGGAKAALAEPRPFGDFIAWLGKQDPSRSEAYFRAIFSGVSAPTPLPPSLARPGDSERRDGAEARISIDEAASARLFAFCRERRLTLNTLLIGAWSLVLSRFSGENEVIVGSTASGRDAPVPGIEEMVGVFIHTLPVRVVIDEEETTAAFLARIQEEQATQRDFEHASLAAIARLSGVPRGQRLFDSLVVLETFPAGELRGRSVPGVTLEAVDGAQSTGHPLTLLVEAAKTISLNLLRDPSRFSLADAERLLSITRGVIDQMASAPLGLASEVEVSPRAERERMVRAWNDTTVHYPRADCLLHELFEQQAEASPNRVAAVFEGESVSYRALDERANRLARRLRSLGVGEDAPVCICMPRSIAMVVAILAVLKAGGAYLPLDPSGPLSRLSFMVADAKAAIVLTEESLLATLADLGARLVSVSDASIDAEPSTRLEAIGSPRSLAYVLYTSGSTGAPKGVLSTHRGIVNRLLWMQDRYRLTPEDVVLHKTPLGFDVSVWELFWPLLFGARLVVARPEGHREPAYIAKLIRAAGVTVLHFVPSMLGVFLEEGGAHDLPSLRRVFSSGEALTPTLRDRFFEASSAALENLYGPTEAAIDVTAFSCERSDRGDSIPIGRPIANTTAYILDRRMRPVPLLAVGELCIGGVQVARGYLGRPELTAERFVRDPFRDDEGARLYRTGDLARYRADGNIELLGRADHQIKLRGVRIELPEIEAVLTGHPSVREAAVVLANARLVAFVSLRERALPAVLSAFLAERLPEVMVPSTYVVCDALPLTVSGKVDRRALPLSRATEEPLAEAYEAPRDATETALCEAFAAVLHLERVGVRDDFFRLGGDSILSIQIVSRARAKGVCVTPRQVFEEKTVARLAAVASALALKAPAAESASDESGPFPLTPAQKWFLEASPDHTDHFNQATLLSSDEPIDRSALSAAALALVAHHDALRMRLSRGASGFEARILPQAEGNAAVFVDLSLAPAEEHARLIEQKAAETQASLDPERGALLRIVSFERGGGLPSRLLIAVHHLAIDGVSFRVLVGDLWSSYQSARQHRPIELPPKTTSFKVWAETLAGLSGSEALRGEADYWLSLARSPASPLPKDMPGGENTRALTDSLSVSLDEERTKALLTTVVDVYRTTVEEAVLTALAEVLCRFAGGEVFVDREGHGREPLGAAIDTSRTVGFFTSVFPLLLSAGEGLSAGDRLRAVKEALRAVPNGGAGYGILRYLGDEGVAKQLSLAPQAEVLWNYLGQLDRALPDASPLSLAPESAGPTERGDRRRRYTFEIQALIARGRLTITWTYGSSLHRQGTVQALAERLREGLCAVVDFALRPDAGGRTPSDYALVRLTQAELDALIGTGPKAREVEDILPLSPLQRGLLFHSVHAPEAGLYIEELSATLTALDPSAFERAFAELVARHATLRTAFAWEGATGPVQIVRKHATAELLSVDLRQQSKGEQAGALDALTAENRRRGFSLGEAPLVRVWLGRLSDSETRLVLCFHHLILDGWALQLLLRELFELYETQRSGVRASLAEPRPYAAYLRWLAEQSPQEAEVFWREELSGFSAATRLFGPRREEATAGAEPRFDDVWVDLPPDVSSALTALGRREGLTMSTVVQGAFAILLHRYAGEDDVVFGATVSGRSAPVLGIETMLGLLINTLPVRVRIDPEASLLTTLRDLQARQTRVRELEHTSLSDVAAWSDVRRGEPLFEALVVFENYPLEASFGEARSSIEVRDVAFRERTGYPLTLTSWAGERVDVRLTYDKSRLDDAAAARMASHLGSILSRLARSPGEKLRDIEILAPEERRHLVLGLNPTGKVSAKAPLVHELIHAQAQARPDAIAVLSGERTLTYAELDRESASLARRLLRRGVGPESLVGVMMRRSVDLVVSLVGILRAGAAYLPLDPTYPEARLAFIVEDARASVVVTERALAASVPPGSRSLLLFDEPTGDADEGDKAFSDSAAHEGSLAYAIYTSGSTGTPRGVAIEHGALANFLASMRVTPGLDSSDVLLAVTSLSFDISALEIFLPLACGARVVVAPEDAVSDGAALTALFERSGATVMQATPSTFRMLLAAGFSPGASHRLLCGGEPLPPALARDLMRGGAELWNMFGPTETTIWSSVHKVSEVAASVPVGRPIDNTTLYVLDRFAHPCPVGVTGELFIGGAGLARGYLGRPDLTAASFVGSPLKERAGERLFRTGDLARVLPSGEIDLLGRRDTQVKLRGHRIELGEIESALCDHPEVAMCAAVIEQRGEDDARLVAHFVPQVPGALVDTSALRAFLLGRLPGFMVPVLFAAAAALPLTPSGKVDRRALPTLGPRAGAPYEAPQNAIERTLAEVWSSVLRVDRVGRRDHFFELGGDSIQSLLIVSRARDANIVVTSRQLFERPTVAELAEVATLRSPPKTGLSAPRSLESHETLPLSPMQAGMLFHSLHSPEAGLYVEQLSATLTNLDRAAFERAFQQLTSRHAALRMSVRREPGGRFVQVIAPHLDVVFQGSDLSGLTENEQRDRALAAAKARQVEGFSLETGPLFRVGLDRLSETETRFWFDFHHIVLDGWALQIALAELFALYDAASNGAEAALAEPAPYEEVFSWLAERDPNAGRAFFREMLEGFRAPTRLSIERDEAGPADAGFGEVWLDLSTELSSRLTDLSRRERVTMSTVVEGAFALLLRHYGGGDDVVFGATVSGRSAPVRRVESLVATLINTLPVRVQVPREVSGSALLLRIQDQQSRAREHEHTPLVEVQAASAIPRGEALFDTVVVFESYPVEASIREAGARLSVQNARFDERTNIPLTVTAWYEGSLAVRLTFDRARFEAPAMERMAEHFTALLDDLAARPWALAASLSPVRGAEREQVLRGFNATRVSYPDAESLLHALFERTAARVPDAVAAVFDGKELTYGELDARSTELARSLRKCGVGVDSLVGVCLDRSLAMMVALLGVLKAGAAYVPLDPSLPSARIAFLIEDSGLSVVVSDERSRSLARSFPGGTRVITLDDDWSAIAGEPSAPLSSGASPASLAYVIHTSGSTGKPKGVMNAHEGIVNRLLWMQETFGLTESDVVLQKTSFAFDVSVWELFWPLLVGARLVLAKPGGQGDASYLTRLIAEQGVTTLHFVPSMLHAFVEDEGLARCTSLRRVMASGEALPAALVARFFERCDAELFNLYGPTEAAVDVSFFRCERGAEERRIPIGRPVANTQLYVLDAALAPTGISVAGDLYIGGVQPARGYRNRPALTAASFVPDPFSASPGARLYKTGDKARWRPDGTLDFLGRADGQVKIRGFRIELEEIEATLSAHPSVREAAVMVHKAESGAAQLVAFCVLGGEPVATEVLRSYLEERLPEPMVPSRWLIQAALPRLSSGKVDRRALSRLPEASVESAFLEPETENEKVLGQIWREVLKVPRVGRHDNYFELGGDSILALQVVSRARDAGLGLSPRDVFAKRTLSQLAGDARPIAALEAVASPVHEPFSLLPIPFADFESLVGEVAGIEDAYPLSPLQRGMLFHSLEAPEDGVYIGQAVFTVTDVDVELLRRAFDAVVARHPTFRSGVVWEGQATPLQMVYKRAAVPFEVHDLRALSPDERALRLTELRARDKARFTDVSRPPLMRVSVSRVSERDHACAWTSHLMLLDGWSGALALKEIRLAYASLVRGEEPSLDEAPGYGEYVAWLAQIDPSRADAFWSRLLRGFSAPTPLGVDRARPLLLEGPSRFFVLRAELDEGLSAALVALSRRLHITLSTIVQVAWAILLSRVSGHDDVVFGTAVSGRSAPIAGIDKMIGLTVNGLPMRMRLDPAASIGSLLSSARDLAAELREHEHTPLSVAQSKSDVPLGQNLFETVVVYVNHPFDDVLYDAASPLQVSDFVFSEAINYAITLHAWSSRVLGFSLTCDRSRVDDDAVARLGGELSSILASIAARPDLPLRELSVLPEDEHSRLRALGGASYPYRREACVHELFEEQARLRPSATAAIYGEESITYAELDRRSNQVARVLRERGVGPEVLVAMCVERSVLLPIAMLGILKAGGAYVPLDPTYPKSRLAMMMADTRAPVLLTQDGLSDRLPDTSAEVIRLDGDAARIERQSADPLGLRASPTQLAYVMYTSGSTGRPKGAGVLHRGVVRLVQDHRFVKLGPEHAMAQGSNACFDPTTLEIWEPLCNGARVVGLLKNPALFPHEMAAFIADHGVTHMWLTTAVLHYLAREAPDALRSLQCLFFGGEAADPKALAVLRERSGVAEMRNIYGPTECSVLCTTADLVDLPAEAPFAPIGKPVDNARVYVLDDFGHLAPIGVVGHIFVGGDGVGRGFWARPAATALYYIPDAFGGEPGARLYRSGDLGRYRADGTIEYAGRSDDQVKVRGYRIELGDVEAALRASAGVREATAIVWPEASGDRTLVAYMVLEGAATSVESVRRSLRETLPEPMIPSAFVVMDALPLTPNGKVDKRSLPAPEGQGGGEAKAYVAARTDLEEYLVRVWENVLGKKPIGVRDNFFELGGHSLLAASLVRKVRESYHRDIPLTALFRAQTIEQFASLLESSQPETWPTLVPIQPRGRKPPLFGVTRPNVNALGYVALARHLGPDQPFFGLHSQLRAQEILGPYTQEEYEEVAAHYIRAMKVVQPEGPYHLAGMCEGAHLAFEMTRQLHAAGERVDLFVIFDTWPYENTHRPILTKVHTVSFNLGRLPPRERPIEVMRKVGRFARRSALKVFGLAAMLGGKPREAPEVVDTRSVFEQRLYPGPDFVPLTTPVHLTVFRVAKQPYWRIQHPELGWTDRTTGGVSVYAVPGDHFGKDSMLREPNVEVVAATLATCLRRAQEQSLLRKALSEREET